MISARHVSLIFILVGALFGNVLAEDATTLPTSQAVGSRPAVLDPKVEKILDRLEAKGGAVKDLQAKIVYTKDDPVLEDKHIYKGILRFKQEEPNPRFFIHFNESNHGGEVSKKKEWHVFDGQDYKEARETTHTINTHHVVEPGKKADVFKLGQGPFPLPFGQKKSDIVQHFSVKLIPPVKGDPDNTDHLECTPLPGTDLDKKYEAIHFYIDRSLDLPVKISTFEKDETKKITATFTETKLNSGMAGAELNLPNLKAEGYKEVEDSDK